MDRRSWLWRRKSTEKSPADTETSASASASSASERFTDEQVRGSSWPFFSTYQKTHTTDVS
jgi:hypothetical protein